MVLAIALVVVNGLALVAPLLAAQVGPPIVVRFMFMSHTSMTMTLMMTHMTWMIQMVTTLVTTLCPLRIII